ncbi:MAG: hypothetical protein ACE5NN_03740 [Candidatus Bathyarchaeia archaeon]
MLYKDDWEEAKETFEEWWSKSLDRPLIQIFVPRYREQVEADSWVFLRYHPDGERALEELFGQFSRILYVEEAYPNVWVNLGPGSLSAYLGAELRFDGKANTAWFQGDLALQEIEDLEFDPDNEWWRYTIKCTEIARERCRDKAVVSFTDLLDAVTVLGQLRGNYPTNLLRDMFTESDGLIRALDNVHEIMLRCYEELCRVINVSENGYSTWAGLWSEKRHFVLQCDTIVYLSPKLFDKFAYPYIIEECRFFDRTLWHLDGPLELHHLGKLLKIPELDAIQWVPGAGNPDGGDDQWLPLYRKVQAEEKLLQLYVPPEKVMHILGRISPNGVAINTVCRTREEMTELLNEFESRYG